MNLRSNLVEDEFSEHRESVNEVRFSPTSIKFTLLKACWTIAVPALATLCLLALLGCFAGWIGLLILNGKTGDMTYFWIAMSPIFVILGLILIIVLINIKNVVMCSWLFIYSLIECGYTFLDAAERRSFGIEYHPEDNLEINV